MPPRHTVLSVKMAAAGFTIEDQEAALKFLGAVRTYSAGDDITAPVVILSGWAAEQRVSVDGERQICRFLVPGDAAGLHLIRAPRPSPVAFTEVHCVEAHQLNQATVGSGAAAKARLMSLFAAEEIRALHNQILRLGGLPAIGRVAHLLLELHTRCRRAGLFRGDAVETPLTQKALAEALGLSGVHVNRIMKQLRADGLIELHRGRFSIIDHAALHVLAGGEHELAIKE